MPTRAGPVLCTRDAGTREALFLPFRTRGLEVEMGKVMPLGGTAQQTGNFGDTQNWVEIPAPSLPSNVTLASYYPQRASPDSQGRGDNEVPTSSCCWGESMENCL